MTTTTATATSAQGSADDRQAAPDATKEGPRIDPGASDGIEGMLRIHRAVKESPLAPLLYELVRTRASQLNGCGYCLDMHTKDARAAGETEQRLHLLPAWREAPHYSDEERAALALTEAVTTLTGGHVPDEVLDAAEAAFDDDELVALLYAIVEINAWNRLAITCRMPVGSYEPTG